MDKDFTLFDESLENFTGREAVLGTLHDVLILGRARTAWISGPPGVGKTALALAFGRRYRREFPGGLLCFHAPSIDGVQIGAIEELTARGERHLIVVDDFEPQLQPRLADEVYRKKYFNRDTRIIVTSRLSPSTSSTLPDIRIELPGLDQGEVDQLLRRLDVPADVAARLRTISGVIDSGSPLLVIVAADAVLSGALTPETIAERLRAFDAPGIIGPDGKPLSQNSDGHGQILTDVRSVSEELLRSLSADPRRFYELTPRRFEEVVAGLLDRLGYTVILTPASKDGGKDIYAAQRDHLGTFLYIVECKRYAPDQPVGVGVIRQLHGVVQAEQATAGILATTSFFTKDAKEFQRKIPAQLSLRDYIGLQGWLQSALTLD